MNTIHNQSHDAFAYFVRLISFIRSFQQRNCHHGTVRNVWPAVHHILPMSVLYCTEMKLCLVNVYEIIFIFCLLCCRIIVAAVSRCTCAYASRAKQGFLMEFLSLLLLVWNKFSKAIKYIILFFSGLLVPVIIVRNSSILIASPLLWMEMVSVTCKYKLELYYYRH